MDLIEQQKLKEKTMVERGVKRYYRQLESATKKGRHYDMTPYSTVLTEMTAVMVPHIEQMQADIHRRFAASLSGDGGSSGRSKVHMQLASLDPVSTAYIVVRTLLQEQGCTTHTLGARIAGVLQMQCQLEEMSAEEGDLSKNEDRRNRIEGLKRTVKAINPHTVKKWIQILDDLGTVEWTWEERVKIGMNLIHVVGQCLTDYVKIHTGRRMVNRRTTWRTTVIFTPHVSERIKEQEELNANEQPWLVPMIAPPREFTPSEDGGYYHIKHDLVKDNYYGVRTDRAAVYPQAVCDAVNSMSRVAWGSIVGYLSTPCKLSRKDAKRSCPWHHCVHSQSQSMPPCGRQ